MFRKQIGDVRHGYVESAGARFVIYGDRDRTLATLRSSMRRAPETVEAVLYESVNEGLVPINTIYGIGYVSTELNRPSNTQLKKL